MLGLLALAWCLVAAPLLHRLTHAHGHQHTHSGPVKPGGHGDGSFEHQSVTFTAGATMPVVTPVLLALVVRDAVVPQAPALVSPRRVEQSQAP